MVPSSVSVPRTMPTNYAFVNYTDMASMHDTSTFTQIRKHAMKQVGAAKRRPKGRNRTTIELFWIPIECGAKDGLRGDQPALEETMASRNRRVAEDKALYDTFIRSLASEMDPFGTASVKLDGAARNLLQYFMFYASRLPNTWTYTSSPLLPNTPAEHKNSIDKTLKSALQDPLLGNALLATAAARLVYVDGTVQPRMREKELSLTQTALQLFQSRFNELSARRSLSIGSLITCALHLGSAAFYKGDVATAALHIRAAVKLAERIGGVMAIQDPYGRGRIISFDDLISCLELRPCVLDDTYDPGPGTTSRQRDSALIGECKPVTRDNLLPSYSMLPFELQELTLQLIHYQDARCQFLQSNYQTTFENLASRQWLTIRLLAIRNRLLALDFLNRRANIARVALVMWTLLPLEDMSQATVVHEIAPKLKDLLEQVPLLDWTEYEDIHLWCLLVGYCCAREDSHVQMWFAQEIQCQFRDDRTDMTSASELSESLIAFQQRFLYHGTVQEPMTKKLADWLACD